MKAIILEKPGSVENLVITEVPEPVIAEGEVLVKVHNISINPVDVKTRKGGGVYLYAKIDPETKLIIGWDISGVVTETRSDQFGIGDEVFGMVNFPGIGNAYAEYVAAPAKHLALKPINIPHSEASGATLAALIAFQTLVHHAGVKTGDRVLIHAAAGGVGHYAVQIAKAMGAYVIGTSSGANRDFILSLGADEHIDYTTTTFEEVASNIDIVIDPIGKDNLFRSLKVLKDGGKLMSVLTEFTDELKDKANAKSITGGYNAVYSSGTDMAAIAELLQGGKIKSRIYKVYPFEQMAEAHNQIETGRTGGKVVVSL